MSGLFSVVLVLHILVAVAMIGIIMLQRSEGGALGIGGGSGSFLSARSAGNVLTRTTVILIAVFFLSSMSLTVLGRKTAPKTLDLGAPAAVIPGAPQPVTPLPVAPPAEMPATQAPDSDLPDLPGFPSSAPAEAPAPLSTAPQPAPAETPVETPAAPAPAPTP